MSPPTGVACRALSSFGPTQPQEISPPAHGMRLSTPTTGLSVDVKDWKVTESWLAFMYIKSSVCVRFMPHAVNLSPLGQVS